MERELSPELMELREALLKLRAGRQCDIDVIRLLELYERFFHDKAPRLLGYHGRRHRHAGGEAGTVTQSMVWHPASIAFSSQP